MTIADIAKAVDVLSHGQQRRFLAGLAQAFTVAARDTYVAGSEDVQAPRGLRAYIEMQHRITACLADKLNGESHDIWTWSYLAECAEGYSCEAAVLGACARALRLCTISRDLTLVAMINEIVRAPGVFASFSDWRSRRNWSALERGRLLGWCCCTAGRTDGSRKRQLAVRLCIATPFMGLPSSAQDVWRSCRNRWKEHRGH